MNKTIIDNWNKTVGKNDIVYYLGDFYMKNPQLAGKLIDMLNGKIYFIRGNHDKVTDIKKYFGLNRFEKIFDYGTELSYINEQGKRYHFILSHYPIWSWNRKKHGSCHLHAHCHFKDPLWNDFDKNGLSMDVGVDGNNFTPIHIDRVIELMEEKKKIIFP